MSCWPANQGALTRFHPSAAQMLQSAGDCSLSAEWSVSRSGLPVARRGGALLGSRFDPQAEADKAVPEDADEADFIVVSGFGLGYLAEAVRARYPQVPLWIAEPDPSWLKEVLEHRDLSALWSQTGVELFIGADPSTLAEQLGALTCGRVEMVSWRPLVEGNPTWHQNLERAVRGAQARARVNLDTYRRFHDLWRRNLHKNEAEATRLQPLRALKGFGEGIPAVIAAAGPSLADQFDWIEAHRDRILLVAVDTAWSSLAVRGLEPDGLLILDGQYWNARHVDRRLPDRTFVVTDWTGPPRAFRLAPGRTFVAATSLPFLRKREESLWGPLGALPSGGSVATAAWSLALHLGCSEVAFAGLDLGFPRGQTHVPGSQFEDSALRRSHRFSPAETLGLSIRGWSGLEWRPGLGGEPVLSDHKMDLFRDWISASVRAHPRVRAINLGPRGTRVPGLLDPPSGYGDSWPLRPQRRLPAGPELRPLTSSPGTPPFDELERLLTSQRLARDLDRAWAAARDFWGQEVWDRWAGRAWVTWNRYRSPASRRAVDEVVSLALTWKDFWIR